MAWIDPEYTTGDTLRAAIADKLGGRIDVIWAEMGNTYNLCYHIWKSGADKVITDAMDGGAIYVGASAGSIMAGRTCQVRIPCAAQRPPARHVSHSGVPHLLYCSLRRWPWENWDDQTCEGTVAVDWTDPECQRAQPRGRALHLPARERALRRAAAACPGGEAIATPTTRLLRWPTARDWSSREERCDASESPECLARVATLTV